MIAEHEAVVAARFDALCDRFKLDVPPDNARLRAIVERLSPLEGRRVLDLGCGKGRFARGLLARGGRVVGLDVSARMLAEASGVPRVKGSARRLPFARASFDAVLAVEVFEHLAVEAVEHVCREVQRVLVPGGTFVVIDKNACSCDSRRPWLPSVVVKWIDELRGLWMYRPGDSVRERWFRPRELKRRLLALVSGSARLAPAVCGRSRPAAIRMGSLARLFVLWAAKAPGGSL